MGSQTPDSGAPSPSHGNWHEGRTGNTGAAKGRGPDPLVISGPVCAEHPLCSALGTGVGTPQGWGRSAPYPYPIRVGTFVLTGRRQWPNRTKSDRASHTLSGNERVKERGGRGVGSGAFQAGMARGGPDVPDTAETSGARAWRARAVSSPGRGERG